MNPYLWLCGIFTGRINSDMVVNQTYCYLMYPESYAAYRKRFGSTVERLYRAHRWFNDGY